MKIILSKDEFETIAIEAVRDKYSSVLKGMVEVMIDRYRDEVVIVPAEENALVID